MPHTLITTVHYLAPIYLVLTVILWLIAIAAAHARFSARRGWRYVLDILFLSPLVLPLPVISMDVGLLVNHLTLTDPYTPSINLLATLPVFYLCALMGFRRVDRETIEAARLHGLRSCGIFWRVFWPVAWPWLITGLVLGLLRYGIMWAMYPHQ